jgi:hypothetical protein
MDQMTVKSILNVLGEHVPKDTSIAVSNNHQFIYYQPSKRIDLKIKPGDKIYEDTVTFKALSGGQKISEFIQGNGFGVPYFGMSVPIIDEGVPTGTITTILPSKPELLFTSFLTVKTNDSWTPIANNQVIYIEAQNRKTRVYSKHVKGFHKLNLSELELILPNDLFIRVHRSYIVNVNHIVEILPDFHSTFLLVMRDGSKIPVSQTYSGQFRRAFGF